jgi:hypothetical protein
MAEEVEEITPLKVALFKYIRRQLVEYGFELNSARDKFTRRHSGITDHFQLVCRDAKPGYRIQPNVGVRIDPVERIFHQTSGFEPQYQDNTSTIGAPVGSLLSGSPRSCEFLMESEFQIASITGEIMRIFREVALPYFEHWSSLTAIDAELNDKPAERTPHRGGLAWFRCSTGIIVARLVDRPGYEQLAAFYLDVMIRDNKGFYLKRFEALLKSLESVEAGTGLAKQP